MGLKMIEALDSIEYSAGKPKSVNFDLYKNLGIAELLLYVKASVESGASMAEVNDNPFLFIEEISMTFDGSKTPFVITGQDLRWVHRLYNGVDVEVFVESAKTPLYADSTASQEVEFSLKLPVLIPAGMFSRATLKIKWGAVIDNAPEMVAVESCVAYPSIVWSDSMPFMLNYAEEEQTFSGNKQFEPPTSETLRHIIIRVTDYTDVLDEIKLKKQRTTIIDSRYEEMLMQQVDLENLDSRPVLGDGSSTLREGLLVVSTPAGIVTDNTTKLKVKTTSSKTVHVLWINAIPIAKGSLPASKSDIMSMFKI